MMSTNYEQLRYGWGAIRMALETVQHTATDVLSDLETDDDRWLQVFKDLDVDIERWIKAADHNMVHCREKERKGEQRHDTLR